ncbi:hypothetical protein B9Z55_026646 [Caenorhabditis nigoni]|uniref:Uncharacterized protein n=1 Tax=Caenorhabditis nigoni TaxID=1611254 RepID=A0A2G5T4J8_9PELO|nr:hypothetical protein B9Z55_026646 [Caenorhabditis nigoni]
MAPRRNTRRHTAANRTAQPIGSPPPKPPTPEPSERKSGAKGKFPNFIKNYSPLFPDCQHDHGHHCPDRQGPIYGIPLNARCTRYIIVADIEKAFSQITQLPRSAKALGSIAADTDTVQLPGARAFEFTDSGTKVNCRHTSESFVLIPVISFHMLLISPCCSIQLATAS